MIYFLMRLHPRKQLVFDVVVSPANIKSEVGEGLSLHEPFVLFGHVLDHSVLGVCVG